MRKCTVCSEQVPDFYFNAETKACHKHGFVPTRDEGDHPCPKCSHMFHAYHQLMKRKYRSFSDKERHPEGELMQRAKCMVELCQCKIGGRRLDLEPKTAT